MSFRGHRRFAKKQSPVRERREIGFAGTGDENTNPEDTNAESPERPLTPDEVLANTPDNVVERMQEQVGASADATADLTLREFAEDTTRKASAIEDFLGTADERTFNELAALLPRNTEIERQTIDDEGNVVTKIETVKLRPGTRDKRLTDDEKSERAAIEDRVQREVRDAQYDEDGEVMSIPMYLTEEEQSLHHEVDTQHVDGAAIVSYLESHDEARELFTQAIERMLDNPYKALEFAHAQQHRVNRYKELGDRLTAKIGLVTGEIGVEKFQQLDERLQRDHGITLNRFLNDKGAESDVRIQVICRELGIAEEFPHAEVTEEQQSEPYPIPAGVLPEEFARRVGVNVEQVQAQIAALSITLNEQGGLFYRDAVKIAEAFSIEIRLETEADRARADLVQRRFTAEAGEDFNEQTNLATQRNIAQRIRNADADTSRQLAMQRNDGFEDFSAPGFNSDTIAHAQARVEYINTFIKAKITQKATALERNYHTYISIPLSGAKTEEIAMIHKVSPEALLKRIGETGDVINRALGKSEKDNLPDISDPHFAREANTILRSLMDIAWMEDGDVENFIDRFLRQDKEEMQESKDYLVKNFARFQRAVDTLKNPARLDVFDAFANTLYDGDAEKAHKAVDVLNDVKEIARLCRFDESHLKPDDYSYLYNWLSGNTLANIETIFGLCESVRFRECYERSRAAIKEKLEDDNSYEAARTLKASLSKVRTDLFPGGRLVPESMHTALQHEICTPAEIPEQLITLIEETEKQIDRGTGVNNSLVKREFAAAAVNVDKLKKAADMLNKIQSTVRYIEDEAEYVRLAGTNATPGCYVGRPENAICLNMKKIRDDFKGRPRTEMEKFIKLIIHHEEGHAILNILAHEAGILPGIYLDHVYRFTGEENRTLMGQASEWHQELEPILRKEREIVETERRMGKLRIAPETVEAVAKERAKELQREYLTDELFAQEATHVKKGSPTVGVSAANRTLYDALKRSRAQKRAERRGKEGDEMQNLESKITIPDRLTRAAMSGDAGEDEALDEEATARRLQDRPDVNQEIRTMRNVKLQQLKTFIESFPQHPQHSELTGLYSWAINALEEEVEKPFAAEDITDDEAVEAIKVLAEHVDPVVEELQKITHQQMDTSGAPRTSRGIGGFMRSFELVSLMDMWRAVQSTGEDLQRMWKRRGERVQSEFGSWVTGWIPDNTIWGLSYAGQLKHEFERRSNASELDEVKQWKDALENVDSFKLLELLDGSRNKDQVRGIVELLVDRGRMDWNQEGFWKTLNYLSNYSMPIVACRNNDLLRDKWLQKLVTDIWDDKDKFNEWRRGNDSNYDSEMDKFRESADQLSNLTGGLNGELKRQLMVWKKHRRAGLPIPESVNPHYYEKVIKYSIDNGKMTMEEKFFYLIQGIRHGLLSIDRLRALAGETGGVLLQFPYLDYFYRKNNSLAELVALGKRLEEPTDPNEPGPKTSLFLHLEVVREESTRERIAKAQDRVAENIDHEDVPLLVSQMDYNQMNNLADVISGSRFKVTREGWKNAYIGFNTKLKVFARISQMKDEKLANLSHRDAELFGQSMVSMLHMDNILTKNGGDGTKRPELSWSEFQTPSPSSYGNKVITYRRAAMNFMHDLINRLEAAGVYNFTQEVGMARDEYFKEEGDTEVKSKDEQQRVFNATRTFNASLSKALSNNVDILTETLKDHADNFWEESRVSATEHPISKEVTKKYIQAMKRDRKQSSRAA